MPVSKERQIVRTLMKACEQILDLIEQEKIKGDRTGVMFAVNSLELVKQAKFGFETIVNAFELEEKTRLANIPTNSDANR